MLTCSAIFVYFVFRRLFLNIRKLADEEHMYEHPEAKSVMPGHETDEKKASRIKS